MKWGSGMGPGAVSGTSTCRLTMATVSVSGDMVIQRLRREEIDKDFAEGFLTKKGYKQKMKQCELLELESDYEKGYLTDDGYKAKKAKLETDVEECSSVVAAVVGKPAMSTKEKLQEIFEKKKDYVAAETTKKFNPSQTSSAMLNKCNRKVKRKAGGSGQQEVMTPTVKRLTVIDCGNDVLVVPKDKLKRELRQQQRVTQIVISEKDGSDAIKDKILKAFQQNAHMNVTFLMPTVSHDLFEAELAVDGWDGGAVLQAYGSVGTVYIRLPQSDSGHSKRTVQSSKVLTVKPQCAVVTARSLATETSFEEIKKDILDDGLLRLLQNESLYHCLDRNKDAPHENASLKPGEFFLKIDTIVTMWLENLHEKNVLPEVVDSFVIMNEGMMLEYEEFAKELSSDDKNLFPFYPSVKHYLVQHGYNVIEECRFGKNFISLPPGNIIDDMCDWIMQSREKL